MPAHTYGQLAVRTGGSSFGRGPGPRAGGFGVAYGGPYVAKPPMAQRRRPSGSYGSSGDMIAALSQIGEAGAGAIGEGFSSRAAARASEAAALAAQTESRYANEAAVAVASQEAQTEQVRSANRVQIALIIGGATVFAVGMGLIGYGLITGK